MSPTAPFPLYLFPSFSFRRRSSTSTTSPTPSPSSSPPTPTYLPNPPTAHLRCTHCLSDLIPTSSIISKGFTGRHGRAYLVSAPPTSSSSSSSSSPSTSSLPNTTLSRPVARQLVTGAHTVADISCAVCATTLGWKYLAADEDAQRYKVGKFILETKRLVKADGWERERDHQHPPDRSDAAVADEEEQARDEVEFDSQDEDECEDLFAGVWSARVAAKRRAERAAKRG
jgi:hypothetical protein